MKNKLFRTIVSICALCSLMGAMLSASAVAIENEELNPQASVYLTAYTAWAVRSSSDEIYIYYDVSATRTIGCLGAKLIVIEMKDGGDWTPVKTYTGTTSNGMLILNDNAHGNDVVYQGTSGNKYRAVVTIFGGSSTTNGDSRIVTTNEV